MVYFHMRGRAQQEHIGVSDYYLSALASLIGGAAGCLLAFLLGISVYVLVLILAIGLLVGVIGALISGG